MNLWDKGKGLLVVILLAVLSSSCEDEENTIGLPVDDQINLKYLEYTIPAEMVWVDSVYSDVGIFVSGKFDFEEAGEVKYTPYISYRPFSYGSSINVPDNALLKEFYIDLDYVSAIDDDGASEQTLSIYQLSDTIPSFVRHYIDESIPFGELLAEKTFTYSPDSLKKDQQDSINYKEKIMLPQALGQEILSLLKNDTEGVFETERSFDRYFKGIAIQPGEGNDVLLGFSSISNIFLTYEYDDEGETKTGTFSFSPRNKYFHQVTPNPSENTLANAAFADIQCCFQGYSPPGEYLYQLFGTGISIKLDLSGFEEFADSLNMPIINSAVLDIENVESTSEFVSPPDRIGFYLTNSVGERLYEEILATRIYKTLTIEDPSKPDPLRVGDPTGVAYSSKNKNYKVNIALFLQHLVENQDAPDYLLMEAGNFLSISGVNGLAALSRNSTISAAVRIPKGSIKIKLYYSTIN